jgi:hypothetical protein
MSSEGEPMSTNEPTVATEKSETRKCVADENVFGFPLNLSCASIDLYGKHGEAWTRCVNIKEDCRHHIPIYLAAEPSAPAPSETPDPSWENALNRLRVLALSATAQDLACTYEFLKSLLNPPMPPVAQPEPAESDRHRQLTRDFLANPRMRTSAESADPLTELDAAIQTLEIGVSLLDGMHPTRAIRAAFDRLRGSASESVDVVTFWANQSEWSQLTFGTDSERGPVGGLRHLIKEADEAIRSIGTPEFLGEIGDCFALTLDAARRGGVSLSKLIEQVNRKLAINKKRTWQKLTSDEPVEHVREPEPSAPTRRDPDCPYCVRHHPDERCTCVPSVNALRPLVCAHCGRAKDLVYCCDRCPAYAPASAPVAEGASDRLRYLEQLDYALRSIFEARDDESTETAMCRVTDERTKEWSGIVFERDAEIATLKAAKEQAEQRVDELERAAATLREMAGDLEAAVKLREIAKVAEQYTAGRPKAYPHSVEMADRILALIGEVKP